MRSDAIRQYIDERLHLAPGTKIQYGHPSPRYWQPLGLDLPTLLASARPDRGLSLYVHIPFCVPTKPGACGFCLFAREDLGAYDEVRRYVETVCLEIDQVADITGRRSLGALYFGGGTPNTLRPPEIHQLFAHVKSRFDLDADCEISFEGYPPLFTDDRLQALHEAGCNRISLGVQTLDPELLAHSGRDAALARTREAIAFCVRRGIRVNADLITGWFDQTTESLVGDVEQLIELGVTDICNHLLFVGTESDFAKRADELPSQEAMCVAFLAAHDRMEELGFREDSYCDYTAQGLPVVRYLDMYRDVLHNDRIGVGYGANSLLAGTTDAPGRTWRNIDDLDDYQRRVRAGRPAEAAGFAFNATDLRLLYVLKGLEGTPRLTSAGYAAQFGRALRADFAQHWAVFEQLGWLRWHGDDPALVGEGLYYTALAQRALSEPRTRELREGPTSRQAAPPRGELVQLGSQGA